MSSIRTDTWTRTLDLLSCPACRRPLSPIVLIDDRNAILGHSNGDCPERYPVIDDIPRIVTGPARASLYRERHEWFAMPGVAATLAEWLRTPYLSSTGDIVVSRFDREWSAFGDAGTVEQSEIFKMYFDIVPSAALRVGSTVLDAGCGAGRWSIQVAARGSRVVALDAGRSVEIAYRNGRPWNIESVQGDVTALPFASASFDLVYSLGVLHHIDATETAAAELVRTLRPGGLCLLYLYYALDGRGRAFRGLFRFVDLVRQVLSRSPHAVLRPITDVLAALVYLPLARTSWLLRHLGLHRVAAGLPLNAYADRSFRVMRNDSLDRFGTRVEKRFTRTDMLRLMERAGLEAIRVADSAPFWHAIGRRPS